MCFTVLFSASSPGLLAGIFPHPPTPYPSSTTPLPTCSFCPSKGGFPWWLSGKEPPANAGDRGDVGSFPGSGRVPGGRCENPLQYSCWENPMDRGAWWATVHRVAKSQTQLKRLSTYAQYVYFNPKLLVYCFPHLSLLAATSLFFISVSQFLFCK